MNTFYRRKMFSPKPIKLNWTDRLATWMNNNVFFCSFVIGMVAIIGLFIGLGY